MTILWPLNLLILVSEHPLPKDQVKAAGCRGVWMSGSRIGVFHGLTSDLLQFELTKTHDKAVWTFVIGKN